jgi:hypothetical protein
VSWSAVNLCPEVSPGNLDHTFARMTSSIGVSDCAMVDAERFEATATRRRNIKRCRTRGVGSGKPVKRLVILRLPGLKVQAEPSAKDFSELLEGCRQNGKGELKAKVRFGGSVGTREMFLLFRDVITAWQRAPEVQTWRVNDQRRHPL